MKNTRSAVQFGLKLYFAVLFHRELLNRLLEDLDI
jgi:hypothetical protein